jgi:hypothetical protein
VVIPDALEERGHVGHCRPSDADSLTTPYRARGRRVPRAIRRLGPPPGWARPVGPTPRIPSIPTRRDNPV